MGDTVSETGINTGIDTASWARRVLALIIDWAASSLVVLAILGPQAWGSRSNDGSTLTLAIYLLENTVLTALMGGSFGKLFTRLRVVRVSDGRPPSIAKALLRSAMILLVIPPLIFRPDGRGLHDMVAGTATVPLKVPA